ECLADIAAADVPETGNVKAGEPLILRGAVNIFGLWGRLRRWLGSGGSEPGAHPLRRAALTWAWPMVILKLAYTPGRVASPLIRRFLLGRRFQQASSGVVIQASTRGRSRTFRTRTGLTGPPSLLRKSSDNGDWNDSTTLASTLTETPFT